MAPHTWVARFVVDHGRVTEEGALLRSFERRRLDEPDADLHVLAEPAGDKGLDLASQALEAVGRQFLQDRLSLTGGLLRALSATHQTLLDWNRRSVPRDQVSAGVTAALVCGTLVYLAQAGPGVAYLQRGGRLQRLVPAGEAQTPLGGGTLQPSLRRFELEPGDVLIGACTALEAILDPGRLESLLLRGSEEALPELYLLTRDLPSFALFAVSCLEPKQDDASEDSAVQGEVAVAPALEPDVEAAARQDHASRSSGAPVLLERVEAREERRTPRSRSHNGGHSSAAAATETLVMAPPLDISRPVVRLRRGLSLARTDYARTTGSRQLLPPPLARPRLLVMLGALALVLFVGAFTVPDLIQQGRSQKLSTLLENARLQLVAAGAEADAGLRRDLFQDARRLANEALRIDSDHSVASDLLQQATAGLAALDAVFELGPMTTVTMLGRQVTGEVSIAAMTAGGGAAYLLDSRGGRVIGVPLQAQAPPFTVYEKGKTYAGAAAKEPLFVTWQGDASSGRLLILDQERKLYEVRPGAPPEPLSLRRTNAWASVAGIATYDGNLYVLDPNGDQVHRYLPAARGFDSEPAPMLTGQRELDGALGLAVSNDIYVYFKDGSLRRFEGGVDRGFRMAGIDRQLKAPIDMALIGGASELYLADSGNKRVVVAGTDGTYRRQLVSSAFTDLRAITVDAAKGLLYVVVGDALLSAPIVR